MLSLQYSFISVAALRVTGVVPSQLFFYFDLASREMGAKGNGHIGIIIKHSSCSSEFLPPVCNSVSGTPRYLPCKKGDFQLCRYEEEVYFSFR